MRSGFEHAGVFQGFSQQPLHRLRLAWAAHHDQPLAGLQLGGPVGVGDQAAAALNRQNQGAVGAASQIQFRQAASIDGGATGGITAQLKLFHLAVGASEKVEEIDRQGAQGNGGHLPYQLRLLLHHQFHHQQYRKYKLGLVILR